MVALSLRVAQITIVFPTFRISHLAKGSVQGIVQVFLMIAQLARKHISGIPS